MFIHWLAKSNRIAVYKHNGRWNHRKLMSGKFPYLYQLHFDLYESVQTWARLFNDKAMLSEFEWNMIVVVWQIEHLISHIVETFNIPWSTLSRVYRGYLMEVITAHIGQLSSSPRVFNDCSQMHLTRIVYGDGQATLAQMTFSFNAEDTKRISSMLVQRYLVIIGYRNRRPTRMLLLERRNRALTGLIWRTGSMWCVLLCFQVFQVDGRTRFSTRYYAGW